ncbi:phospholipase [Salibacterium salarium]|uniref:Phospholipase n=1 Tax=Salibacterium salarium TaxID=284579 RepID=A0A428N9L6_9BACI|nr:phospholipase [Salibacterium salarium]RSL35076.1 phospholipase [Salibacterium salarium]
MAYNYNNRRLNRPRLCIFPGYNWCGPGCSGPRPPINAVDAACKAHDECYRKFGNYCGCDQAFIKQLMLLQNPYTLEGRHARTILRYMKIQRFFTCS